MKVRPLRFISPLHRANRQLSLRLGEDIAPLGVSGPDAHILSYVDIYGPCAVGELVRVFGHRKPTMTSMLDRLEGRRLLSRKLNPDDRRSFLVRTTSAGSRLARRARLLVEALDREIGRRVGRDDIRGFENVLRALSEATGLDVRQNKSDNVSPNTKTPRR